MATLSALDRAGDGPVLVLAGGSYVLFLAGLNWRIIAGLGIVFSIIGTWFVRINKDTDSVMAALNKGNIGSIILTAIASVGAMLSILEVPAAILTELNGPDSVFMDGPGGMSNLLVLMHRGMSIAGGTSEIKRNQIGERILGLPRDPLIK